MIDQLKLKLASYTPEKWNYDDSNDPNILIGVSKTTAIEWDDTGFYQIYRLPSKDEGDVKIPQTRISYTSCVEGHTYALSQNFNAADWGMYQQVYLEGVRTKQFRVDVPLERALVDVNGEEWEYTRVMRPGTGTGEKINNLTVESVTDFYQSSVDDYYNLLSSYIAVGKRNGIDTIPNVNIMHKARDDQGYYYTRNGLLWNKQVSTVVGQSLVMFEFRLSQPTIISAETKAQILEQARTKWSTLL